MAEKFSTGISMDREVYEKTKALAKAKNRTFSNYIHHLLLENLKKEGVIEKPKLKLLRKG